MPYFRLTVQTRTQSRPWFREKIIPLRGTEGYCVLFDREPADVAVRSAAGTGSRFFSQALNISLLCTASPGGCPLCRLSKNPCRRTGESTPLGGKSGSDCRGVRVCEQKSRAGGRGNRVTQRGKSGEAASSDGEIHAAWREVRQRLTGESDIS